MIYNLLLSPLLERPHRHFQLRIALFHFFLVAVREGTRKWISLGPRIS